MANSKKPTYKFDVDIDAMTWGDASLQARFALLQGTMESAGEEEAAQMSALREMVELFDEMTELLDRVAIVERDGERIPAKAIPQHVLGDVMTAIADAQAESSNPKNSKPVS